MELTIGLGLVVLMGAMSAPLLAGAADAGRARAAAQYVAGLCREARAEAIGHGRASAIAFTFAAGEWRLQACRDGNGDGVRRTDIARAVDPCTGVPTRLSALFRGVAIAVDASVPDPDGGAGTADPVRFGTSDLASFGPAGTATAGSVYVRSAGGVQYAVRVAGATGRTRVLRYEPATRTWQEA